MGARCVLCTCQFGEEDAGCYVLILIPKTILIIFISKLAVSFETHFVYNVKVTPDISSIREHFVTMPRSGSSFIDGAVEIRTWCIENVEDFRKHAEIPKKIVIKFTAFKDSE